MSSYDRAAAVYDQLYTALKNYEAEAGSIDHWIQARNPGAQTLLDVACGTGLHLEYLSPRYRCTGLDLSDAMLTIARERNPRVDFHQGDMTSFDLAAEYDAVICMFSAIGHARSTEELDSTLVAFARHLSPGGVCILEPWVTPDQWIDGYLSIECVDDVARKVSRVDRSWREGRHAVLDMYYTVGTADGVDQFNQRLEVTLFTEGEYRNAFQRAGFEQIEYEGEGFMGRGMYFGSAPMSRNGSSGSNSGDS